MSSIVDCAAERESVIDVAEMTADERLAAAEWMTAAAVGRSGNPDAVFRAEWLPSDGLAAHDFGGRTVMVAALYLDRTSPTAVCGWCVGNPINAGRTSRRAAEALMRAMPEYAKRRGAAWLMTTFGNRGLNRILDRLGFTTGETAENKFLLLR